jgi:hypothetical protein
MSHLLIVQNAESENANGVFAEGLSLFSTLCGLRPCDSVAGRTLAVAVFPRAKARGSGIVRDATRWLCGAGTWFCQGVSGETGLRKMLDNQVYPTNSNADLRDLDGQFVVAAGDCDSGELAVVTDRLGILHVYAVQVGTTRIISTSSMVLAALARSGWDPEGYRQFLASGTIFEPKRTLFKGINKFEDARVYRFTAGGVESQRRYWSVESALQQNDERTIDAEQVSMALQHSLRMVHRNFPKPLLDFTGGFDTRGIVGAMLKANLSLDLVVNGSDGSPDVVASTRVAKELGLRQLRRFRGFNSPQDWWNRSKESIKYCDGECDVLQYAGTLEAQLRNSDGFDATVNGAIGEVLKGHWWELLFPHTGRVRHFDCHRVARRRFTFEGEVPGLLAFSYGERLTDYYAEVLRQSVSGIEGLPNTTLMDTVYLVIRQQKWLGRMLSATDHIWPCISPYGFTRILELAISAPVSAKLHHRLSRRLIEYQEPVLSRLPLPEGYPAAPLRLTTMHQFWPLLLHYARISARRLLIDARLRKGDRITKTLYPRASFPLSRLVELEEIQPLLDPSQMRTRELYDAKVLRRELNKCLRDTSTNAFRMGRILTLELLARSIHSAGRGTGSQLLQTGDFTQKSRSVSMSEIAS